VGTEEKELIKTSSSSSFSRVAVQVARSVAGILLIVAGAVIVSRLFSHTDSKGMVPLVFAVVPILVAAVCGLTSGLVGTVLSALVFAHFLFAPGQSLVPYASLAGKSLGWMLLTSITFSYLLFPPDTKKHDH
jgi:K+-sensing histidine kinase KdpD